MAQPTPIYQTAPSTTVLGTSKCEPPTVSLIGAGGCGINTVRVVKNFTAPELLDDYLYIDTSHANIRDDELSKHLLIASGHGSGKHRISNAEEIQRNIAQTKGLPDTDVFIVVFGLSGGSGSVISPVLLNHLAQKGKRVVAAIVADTSSQIDAYNTKKTLQSLQSIADRNSLYLPVILVDNTEGRREADRIFQDQLTNLIRILKYPTVEVDRNDRLAWLNPSKITTVSSGLHMLYVDTTQHRLGDIVDLLDDSLITDSVLSLGAPLPDGTADFMVNVARKSRFRKEGLLTTNANGAMIGVITNSSFRIDQLIKSIDETEQLFNSQSSANKNKIQVSRDDIDDSGLVF